MESCRTKVEDVGLQVVGGAVHEQRAHGENAGEVEVDLTACARGEDDGKCSVNSGFRKRGQRERREAEWRRQ
jgi:hypothetical protein